MAPELAWQASLFDDGTTAPDISFAELHRLVLDEPSWLDYAPGWLTGSDELFAVLLQAGSWQQREVTMYDRTVLEPRLTAGWSTHPAADSAADCNPVPPALSALAEALSRRYGVGFDRIWVSLYRDGADSVAWHGDRNRKVITRPLVATVSLGACGASCCGRPARPRPPTNCIPVPGTWW